MLRKKNTATITFHKAINYGAILQTYALQQSLLKLNIENKIINYTCKEIEKMDKLIRTDSLRTFIKTLINIKSFYYKRNIREKILIIL